MNNLISPTSSTPTKIKAAIRWAIVQYQTRIRNRRFVLHEYGEGVPTWKGWIEHNGIAIAFIDNEGKNHYQW